jgi:hypothetical protein
MQISFCTIYVSLPTVDWNQMLVLEFLAIIFILETMPANYDKIMHSSYFKITFQIRTTLNRQQCNTNYPH